MSLYSSASCFPHLLSSGEARLGIFCLVLGSWYKKRYGCTGQSPRKGHIEMVKGLEERLRGLGLLRGFISKRSDFVESG